MDHQLPKKTSRAFVSSWARLLTTGSALAVLAAALLQPTPLAAVPVSSPPRVLILDETVIGGAGSQEGLAAQLAIPGCAVDVCTAANWGGIPATGTGGPTGFGFDSYRAIIIGDPQCATYTAGYLAALTALNTTKTTWTPVTTGNVIIMGIDNALHSFSQVGADKTVKRGVGFAVNDPTKTGLYYAVSCYYDYTAPATTPTLVPHLTGFGTFMTRNYPGACFNNAHQVATHAVFTAAPPLTDAELSNWNCSTHEGFDVWPPNFVVLAIALTNGAYTASDGSNGVPYILVRGEGIRVFSNITLDPPSATNNVGTTHTVCATISTNVNPRAGVTVTFNVVSGPNVGTTGTGITASNGVACFTYTDTGGPGVDYLTASFVMVGPTGVGITNTSATVMKTWIDACAVIGCEDLNCVTNGVWTYRFCVTNLSPDTIQYVSLFDTPPGVSFNTNIITLSPPLTTGQGTNITVIVNGPNGMTNFCYTLGIHTTNFVRCCGVLHCVNVPECCTRVLDQKATFVSSSGSTMTYNYTITFQNLSLQPVKYVFFVPDQPCVTFIPSIVNVTLPVYGGPSQILPGQIRTLTVQMQVTVPCPGPLTFLLATLNSNMVECCSSRLRLPAKGALRITSPADGVSVLSETPLVIDAALAPGFTVREVRFYRDSTLLGADTNAPYSISLASLEEGSYTFSAAALFDTGELETSPPVHVSVLSPHQHVGVPLSVRLSGPNTLAISLPAEAGHVWRIEYSSSLLGPWTVLQTITGDGSIMTVNDVVSAVSQRFYRAVLLDH